ncbi:DUF4347 domain-containing protein [Kovacikia minuta CCNUW1]|uniref:DUF4347 domain-containing protein n=1 Tax=Kovacikia minuta TaxID=2931930 RepID=UPI001CC8F5E3|nr:DUF4347 domain-containing protein [Kovacikia minuta]UBF26083.1 DUF4347 domain-containing protein [Kovacikia minuta CCNUW1]
METKQSFFLANHGSWASSLAASNAVLNASPDRPLSFPDVSSQSSQHASSGTNLVFIDSRVNGYQNLLDGLTPGTEAYVLSSTQDAIAQITQILLNHTGVSSLHIISHGQSAGLQIGANGLNETNLSHYASELQSWKQALAPEADILLYGCDVAQTDAGKSFVHQLAQLTGGDVAASDDLTGSSPLGGDWNLEFNVGEITTSLALQANILQNYAAVLQTAPVLDTAGSPFLDAISQGATNPTGTTIATLLSRLGGTGITDVDRDPRAIAVTSVNNTNGTWQYSTNGGTSWTNFGAVSNTSATVLGATSLYSGSLGTTPDTQNWLSFTSQDLIPPTNSATQTVSNGGTTLNSTIGGDNGIYTGYSNYNTSGTLQNTAFPVLNRAAGYSITFKLQVLSESRTNQSRAGFSIITISSDGTRGIELGFQQLSGTTGNIFAQGDGNTPNPGGQANGLFLAAENVSFNTNQDTTYTLSVLGNNYQLFANGAQILTGPLRDYTGFNSPVPIDPYELPSFLFLGDNTTSAQANVKLSQVVVQTDTRIRFVPNPGFVGTANLSFRAWDTTNGSANGATGVNASVTGNTTAFSAATETAIVNVITNNPGSAGQKTLYWRNNTSGGNSIWQLNGTSYQGSFSLPTLNNANWTIAGIADFTGEGEADIVWQNRATGQTAIWQLLDGITYSRSFALPTLSNTNWAIAGVADFDGDTRTDLLWRNNATGQNVIWKLNGTTYSTAYALPTLSNLSWTIVGVADFDGDTRTDLLWRNNATGQNVIWKLNGTTYSTAYALPTLSNLSWTIAGVADLDGDGQKNEVLWRNTATGQNVIWKLNGTSYSTAFTLPPLTNANWSIAAITDFDGDTQADLLWRNRATGQAVIWQLDGSAVSGAFSLPMVAGSSWNVYVSA